MSVIIGNNKCKHKWQNDGFGLRYCVKCDSLQKLVFPGYDNLDKIIWEDLGNQNQNKIKAS